MVEKVIVTVKIQGVNGTKDIEIPTDMKVREFIENSLSVYLGTSAPNPDRVRLKAEPSGKMLVGDDTIAESGVWDGYTMTLLY